MMAEHPQRYLAAAQKSGGGSESFSSHLEAVQTAALAKISDLQTPPPTTESAEVSDEGETDLGTETEFDGGEETASFNTLNELLPRDD